MRKLLITLAMLTISTASAATPPLTPASIRMDIRNSGAKAVVARLFSSGHYDFVMSKIEAGSPAWVLLAKPLSSGTDAATSEELQQTLIHALPKSPRAVLAIMDTHGSSAPRSPETVCSASFFEGDRTNVAAYRSAAIKAVEAVDAPALQPVRIRCLKTLAPR